MKQTALIRFEKNFVTDLKRIFFINLLIVSLFSCSANNMKNKTSNLAKPVEEVQIESNTKENAKSQFQGKWTLSGKIHNRDEEFSLVIYDDSGSFTSKYGAASFSDIKFEKNKMSFTFRPTGPHGLMVEANFYLMETGNLMGGWMPKTTNGRLLYSALDQHTDSPLNGLRVTGIKKD